MLARFRFMDRATGDRAPSPPVLSKSDLAQHQVPSLPLHGQLRMASPRRVSPRGGGGRASPRRGSTWRLHGRRGAVVVISLALAVAGGLAVVSSGGSGSGGPFSLASTSSGGLWGGSNSFIGSWGAPPPDDEEDGDNTIEDVRRAEIKAAGDKKLRLVGRPSRLPRRVVTGAEGAKSSAIEKAIQMISDIEEEPASPDDGGPDDAAPDDGGDLPTEGLAPAAALVEYGEITGAEDPQQQQQLFKKQSSSAAGGGKHGGGKGGGGKLRIPVVMTPTHPQIVRDLAPWAGGVNLEEMLAAVARDMEKPSAQRRLVLCAVIDGRLVMDYNSWGSNRRWAAKLSDFSSQLRSVLQAEGVDVPDVVFVAQVASLPFLRKAGAGVPTGASPIFSMAKSDAFADVLFPNPYFGRWDKWERSAGGLLALADALKWEDKQPTAFWRGSCVNWPGSLPRVDLVLKWDQPRMDVAFTRGCPVDKWPPIFPDRERDRLLKRTVRKLPTSRIVSRADFAKYKFLFHMPGSTHGSYSRNLQIVLGTGSVVLKWDNPFYEFFYSTLEDGVHYVSVNASTAVPTVERLVTHDAAAKRIADSTVEWFREHLRGRHIRDYWAQLLTAYAKLQTFKPALPAEPCSCDKDRNGLRRCKVC